MKQFEGNKGQEEAPSPGHHPNPHPNPQPALPDQAGASAAPGRPPRPLGQWLKQLGYSQKQLALEARVNPATLNKLVNGRLQRTHYATARAIVAALNRASALSAAALSSKVNKPHHAEVAKNDDPHPDPPTAGAGETAPISGSGGITLLDISEFCEPTPSARLIFEGGEMANSLPPATGASDAAAAAAEADNTGPTPPASASTGEQKRKHKRPPRHLKQDRPGRPGGSVKRPLSLPHLSPASQVFMAEVFGLGPHGGVRQGLLASANRRTNTSAATSQSFRATYLLGQVVREAALPPSALLSNPLALLVTVREVKLAALPPTPATPTALAFPMPTSATGVTEATALPGAAPTAGLPAPATGTGTGSPSPAPAAILLPLTASSTTAHRQGDFDEVAGGNDEARLAGFTLEANNAARFDAESYRAGEIAIEVPTWLRAATQPATDQASADESAARSEPGAATAAAKASAQAAALVARAEPGYEFVPALSLSLRLKSAPAPAPALSPTPARRPPVAFGLGAAGEESHLARARPLGEVGKGEKAHGQGADDTANPAGRVGTAAGAGAGAESPALTLDLSLAEAERLALLLLATVLELRPKEKA